MEMEENHVGKHIKLERSDDAPGSSILLSLLSENQFVLDDASLKENVEICSIEKQDPELFDSGEFLTIGVDVDDEANGFEEDNDINVNEYVNDDVKYVHNNEAQSFPIKLEKRNYVDIGVFDSLEDQAKNINLKTKSYEQREKEKKQRDRINIFKQYFVLLCPYCGIEIKNMKIWKEHMNSAHNFDKNLQQYYTFIDESHKQCNECRVVLKAKLKQYLVLQAHTITHLPHSQIFKCRICSKHRECEAGMRWHIETEHIEVIGSILLAHGFDVEHHKNSDSDTDSDDLDNIKETELNEIADIFEEQQTQHDNGVIKQKTKLQKQKDILKKYMIRLCPVCGEECGQEKRNWWMHVKSVHNLTSNLQQSYTFINKMGMQCNKCKIVLRINRQDLLRHNITHLPYKQIFKCKICAELRTWTRGIRGHIEREHADIVRKKLPSLVENTEDKYCVYCEKNIGYKVKFIEHMQKEHGEICKNKILLICPECGLKFSRERLYRLHINSVHKFNTPQGLSFEEIVGDVDDEAYPRENKMKYRCIKCDLLFASCKMTILKGHAITHLPHQNYKCRYCDYSDTSKRKLLMHTCKELIDAFKSVPEIVHKQIRKKRYQPLNRKVLDRTDKLYVCPSCGEEFNTVILHDQHLKLVHEFENVVSLNINMTKEDTQYGGTSLKYVCNICNQSFKLPNISNFKLHAFKHMPFKLYKCALCHTSSTKLTTCPCKDSDTINGITFICPKCDVKQFKNEKEWLAHIQEYHADFVTPNGLNFEQIHKEDAENLTYKCNNCGKIIKHLQLSSMLVHSLEHMSNKCFKCKICERSYDCKGDALYNAYSCIQMKLSSNKWHDDETTFAKNWRTCSKFAKCQCPVCGFLDEDNDDIELVDHLKQAHSLELQSAEHMNFMQCTDCTATDKDQRKYKCLECNQMLADCSIMQLQEHKLAHLPYRMWHCGFCTWEFNTKAKVLYHIINWHIQQEKMRERDSTYLLSFACPVCNERFDLNTDWRTHLNSKHAFNTLIGLRLVQEGNSFRCIDCKCRVRRNRKFTHRFRHLIHKPYKCRFCSNRFKTLNCAREHATACREKKEGEQKLNNKALNSIGSNSGDTENIEQGDEAGKIEKQKICDSRNKYIGYACPECNVPLSTEELWYMHINEQHSSFSNNLNIKEVLGAKLKGICLECNKEISGNSLVREQHKMQHMPYRSFICKICRHRSKSKTILRKHFAQKHFASVEFICVICSHVCNTHYDFSIHMKTQHTNIASWPANLCPICIDFLADGTNVDLHIKTNHLTDDIEEYEKETEGKLLLKSELDEQTGLVIKNDSGAPPLYDIATEMILPDIIPSDSHEIANVAAQAVTSMATCSSKSTALNKFYPYITYACPECNLSLPTQKEWHSHITTKHDFFAEHSLNIKDTPGGASKSICLECGSKVFGSILHKHRHKLTHMPYRSFICTMCLHRSKNQNGLFDHMRRKHFTRGEYKCEMCPLVFKTACERYTHAKTEHKDIEWPINVCPICVSTLSQWSISEHIKTHGLDREQFPCGYCAKYYLSKFERTRHLRDEHPSEYEKEQLGKEPVSRRDRKSKDCKKPKSDIKIKAENEEFVANIDRLSEEIPTTSKGKRGRPKKKTTESITECSTSGLNKLIVFGKRKRGRPKKIETIKFEADSNEDSDYNPNLKKFVSSLKVKLPRKRVKSIKRKEACSDTESE